jgi:hypothetical protein
MCKAMAIRHSHFYLQQVSGDEEVTGRGEDLAAKTVDPNVFLHSMTYIVSITYIKANLLIVL